MTPNKDIVISVTAKPTEDGWIATSKTYPGIEGVGEDADYAIDDFCDELNCLYTQKFRTANNMPPDITRKIIEMTVEISLTTRTEKTLDTYGITIPADAIKKGAKQAEKYRYENFLHEATDGRTCGSCNKASCTHYGEWDNMVCEIYEEDPDEVPLECTAGIADEMLEDNEVNLEAGGSEAPPAGSEPGNNWGVSLDKYTIDNILSGDATAAVLPKGKGEMIGGTLYLYERADNHGAKAFRGSVTIEDVIKVPKSDIALPAWKEKHQMPIWKLDASLINKPGDAYVAMVVDPCEFPCAVEVPDGEKAPRGLNWLTNSYVESIEAKARAQD